MRFAALKKTVLITQEALPLCKKTGSQTLSGYELIHTYEKLGRYDDVLEVLNNMVKDTWSNQGKKQAEEVRTRLLAAKEEITPELLEWILVSQGHFRTRHYDEAEAGCINVADSLKVKTTEIIGYLLLYDLYWARQDYKKVEPVCHWLIEHGDQN